MKKVNFNQLNNIKTPEDWIQKAINVPQENNKIIKFSKLSVSVIAASFVCICTVSVLIATNFSHKIEVPVSSVSTSLSETQNSADTSASSASDALVATITQPTDNSIFSYNPLLPSNSSGASQRASSMTDFRQYNTTDASSAYTNGNLIPSASGGSPDYSVPVVPSSTVTQPVTEPSETHSIICSGDSAASVEDAEKPSSIPNTTMATESTIPPTVPDYTVKPDEPSHGDPPEYENPSEPCVEPTMPIYDEENPTSSADDASDSDKNNVQLKFYLADNSRFDPNKPLYCHITSEKGIKYSEEFSERELCVRKNDYFEYSTKQNGIYLTKSGYYNFRFYDESGNKYVITLYVKSAMSVVIYE